MRLANGQTARYDFGRRQGFQWRFNDPGNGRRYLDPQAVPDITKFGSSQQIVILVPNTKSHGNPSSGRRGDTRPTYVPFPATRTRFKEPQCGTNISNRFSSLLHWHVLDNTTEHKKIIKSLLNVLHRRTDRQTHKGVVMNGLYQYLNGPGGAELIW